MKRSSYQDVACTPEAEEEYGGKTGDDEYKESGGAVDDDTSDGKSCKDDKMAKLKKHPGAPKRFRTYVMLLHISTDSRFLIHPPQLICLVSLCGGKVRS